MNIQFIPIDLIDEYENNSNTHPEDQLHQIEALITEFGFTTPALVQSKNGRYELIAGHGRYEVVSKMWSSGKLLNMADGTPIVKNTLPVIIANDWTENQVRAYVMADNQVARNSIFNMDVVAEEIKILEDADFDVELLGFVDLNIDDGIYDIETDYEANESREFDENDLETNHECPKCGFEF